MADRDNKHYHHHYHPSNRPRSGQNRLYNSLGVKDLREILDKKRSERSNSNDGTAPPPDPEFNYLKDPLRENADESRQRDARDKNQADKNRQGRQGNRPKMNKDIENPCNIKIEFSTSTGEHTYKLDETEILPTIKHVPDQKQYTRPSHYNQRNNWRGRGRDNRPPRQYYTRTIKNQNPSSSNCEIEAVTVSLPVDDSEEQWQLDDPIQTNTADSASPTEQVGIEEQLKQISLDESPENTVEKVDSDINESNKADTNKTEN